MRFYRTAQRAPVFRQPRLAWPYALLPACLLALITLLQALPAHPVGVGALETDRVERVVALGPGLLASHELLRQLRRDAGNGLDDAADGPLDFLITLFLPLVLSGGLSLVFTAPRRPSLLPVVIRPGAPRGPPAGL